MKTAFVGIALFVGFQFLGCSTETGPGTVTDTVPTDDTTAPIWENAELTAKAGTDQVELSWTTATDDVGVVAYLVFQDGAQIAEQPGTELQVAALQPNSNYTFTVEAVDAAGNVSAGGPGATVTTGADWDADPNTLDQETLFQCNGGGLQSSPSRLRRMERREWTHHVGKPMAGTWWGSVAKDNPFDAPAHHPYSSYSKDVTVDLTTLTLYLTVLSEAGANWTDKHDPPNGIRTYTVNTDNKLQCIYSHKEPSDECLDYFITKYLREGVLFRPPTGEEFNRLRAFLVKQLALENPPGDKNERQRSLLETTSAGWLMAGALFKTEMGNPADDDPNDGRHQLTHFELARALSGVLSTRAPGGSALFVWNDGPQEHFEWSAPPEGYLAGIATAAADGTIGDPQVRASLVKQYIGGVEPERFDLLMEYKLEARVRRGEYWLAPRVADFFREWLGYTRLKTVFKDIPGSTSQWDSADDKITTMLGYVNLLTGSNSYEATLKQHLDDTIARVVVEDTGVLQNLLTTRLWRAASNVTNTNSVPCTSDADCLDADYPLCTTISLCGNNLSKGTVEMHRIYNRTENIPDTPEGRWIEVPGSERAGVLTHPTWLAALGGNFEDDPSLIQRGKWIREKLFCQTVPPLDLVAVEAQVLPSAEDKTARDRVVEATENGPDSATCMGCHSLMNSLGYPFETYNHAGYVRYTDHGKAPDGSAVINNAPDPALNGPVKDAVEFSQKLSQSPHAKRCFIRQSFRFFMGRNETPADACTLTAMETAYDPQGSFIDMLVALVTSDTFTYRHHEEL